MKTIVDIEINYCGGVGHRYFKDMKEAFRETEKKFGPIYYDEKNNLYFAIVDGIELYIYPTVVHYKEEATDMGNCADEEIVWDPSQILFKDEHKEQTMPDIENKYFEAVKRAFEASVDWHENAVNGKTEMIEKIAKKQAKYTNYAVALGWVLGIPRETTEYNCDCEL